MAKVLVTGGAGYVGSVLSPRLLEAGHSVTVFDTMLYGEQSLRPLAGRDGFELVVGDLRDRAAVEGLLARSKPDALIHLAAISNDPSSELDPELTRDVNLRALETLMPAAKRAGVRRFLYASSASVYGVRREPEVTEDLPLEPITLYARYKAEGEEILNGLCDESFCGVSVRAATVCGYSPRMRLDLTINILTEHAVRRRRIRVFGGSQLRPNLHIEDLARFYLHLLGEKSSRVNGSAFNICAANASVLELAEMVRAEIDPSLPIEIVPTEDLRSYHLSAIRAERELGFHTTRTLQEAIREVAAALSDGRIADPEAPIHRNVEWMKLHREFWRSAASTGV